MVVVAVFSVGCESSGERGGGRDGSSGGSSPAGPGETVKVNGTEAIVWGEGERGAVLAHGAAYDAASWEEQGRRISESGAVTLEEERGVRTVTLVGASAGTGGVLGAAEANPGLADGLILLSGTGDVSGLGEYPKLFVTSDGEGLAGAVRGMAGEARGDRNDVLILPGDAHAQAIFETDQGERLVRAMIDLLKRSG